MRDYLSPARSYFGRAKAQVASLSKVTLKPRVVAMFASTATVAFFAASVVALRSMNNDSSQNNVVSTSEAKIVPGSTSVTQIGDPQPSIESSPVSTQSSVTQSTSGNSSDTKTSIVVNNQPVDVPENGSVHKTITSDGNTTHVDVSVSSSGTTNNSSSSFIQMNTNTSSQSMNIHSP